MLFINYSVRLYRLLLFNFLIVGFKRTVPAIQLAFIANNGCPNRSNRAIILYAHFINDYNQ